MNEVIFNLIVFFAGLVIGGLLGVFIICICIAGGGCDEKTEELFQKELKQKGE
jgi:hypothetical protein